MKRAPNPVAARIAPPIGQPLPANFHRAPLPTTNTYDQRPLSELWKQPMSAKPPVESLTRNARLQPVSWQELYGQK
jgi:hypothetical protein